jgi:voltage-gated potassium channel
MSVDASATVPGDRRERRRMALVLGARCALSTAVALGLYAALPVHEFEGVSVVLRLALAVVAFIGVVGWQTRSILHSRHPQLRALEVLITLIALLLVMFAYGYLTISASNPDSFNQPLDHPAALYFTTTVLATVGFGDITPVSSLARMVVSFQMVLDLVVIGVMVRLIFTVAQRSVARRDATA